jgi:hypothetical protein
MNAAPEKPAGGAGQPGELGLDELRRLLAALLAAPERNGGQPSERRGTEYLDSMTHQERAALTGQVARRLLGELDGHLAAGRLLDFDILEQRAG